MSDFLDCSAINSQPGPCGAPNFTPSVDKGDCTLFVEQLALSVVDMSIAAVLLFPHHGHRENSTANSPPSRPDRRGYGETRLGVGTRFRSSWLSSRFGKPSGIGLCSQQDSRPHGTSPIGPVSRPVLSEFGTGLFSSRTARRWGGFYRNPGVGRH